MQDYSRRGEFAQILNIIADSYRGDKNYTRSIELYQQVIDGEPDEKQKLAAYTGLAMSYCQLDDPNMVYELVEIIRTDFAGHAELGGSLFTIGEEYFTKAFPRRLCDKSRKSRRTSLVYLRVVARKSQLSIAYG